MRFQILGLWLVGIAAVVAAAAYLTQSHELAGHLTALFLAVQPWLPLTLTFEQFLVGLTIASLITGAVAVGGCTTLLFWWFVRQQRRLMQVMAAAQESERVHARARAQYEQLRAIGQLFSTQLEKRILVRNIVEAASRLTSLKDSNSVVSLWMLNFETDTFHFEQGLYCDETLFTKTAFEKTELPFSRLVASQQPWVSGPTEEGMTALVKPEQASQLGQATVPILIPLVIENDTLGALVLYCHPDFVRRYEENQGFYAAVWEEITLALAIAIQGAIAILDRLTGVYNREYFMKRLLQELERSNRYQVPVSLLMIDIDNFKQVNDMLGHPQGDAVLRIIATLIKKRIRVVDLVARYGGEEFIVMLPGTGYGDNLTRAAGAALVGERIRKAVDDEFRGMQKPLNLTVSIGISCRRFPDDRSMDYRDLIRVADEQLYRSKTTGKNKVSMPTPVPAEEAR